MFAKRIIPCLDVFNGRTVKGTNFVDLKDAGDPVELAARYCDEGADELVFLDITATVENRKTIASLVRRVAQTVNIPFTVGGGIRSLTDVEMMLHNGADKISVNSAAVNDPSLISELAKNFGSQCIVVAIDAKPFGEAWEVVINGGRKTTGIKVADWAAEVTQRGAGEILLTSMQADGTKDGYSIELTNLVSTSVGIPVIASGGAGKMEHFKDVFTRGSADAALAASVFHYKEIDISSLKTYLDQQHIPVRL